MALNILNTNPHLYTRDECQHALHILGTSNTPFPDMTDTALGGTNTIPGIPTIVLVPKTFAGIESQ